MKAKSKKGIPKKLVLIIVLIFLVLLTILFFSLKGPAEIRKIYYGHKASSMLATESKKLSEPLKALGFTNIEGGKSVCLQIKEYGYESLHLSCSAEFKSYRVFNDDTSKAQAVNAAQKISTLLNQNGWHRGNYELGAWVKDVMNKIDYNADAYHYKYFGNTFCVFDLFEAYSNPKPPAVQAIFSCTTPELHPPIY